MFTPHFTHTVTFTQIKKSVLSYMNRSENRLQVRPDREISQNVSLVSVCGYSREVDEPTAVLSW